jgi:hypothetical protein
MDELLKRSAAGEPFVVLIAQPSHRRLAVEVFAAPRGLVFVDAGWAHPEQTGHPFHYLEGDVQGRDGGPWLVGRGAGAPLLVRLEEGDPLCVAWLDWQAWTRTSEGRSSGPTRERAKALAEHTFRLPLRA